MNSALPLIIIFFILLGCNEDSPFVPESDLVVVQAYLYANEPVKDIRLTSTLTLDEDTTHAPAINEAVITLIKDGQRFDLSLSPGDSGYYHYPGNDLMVNTGDEFKIEIEYNDQFIIGQTQVPVAPESLTISDGELPVPDLGGIGSFDRDLFDSLFISIDWMNDDATLFFVVLDNVEGNPLEIETGFGSFPRRFISQPINRNSFRLNFRMVTHYGRHRVKLYRINQEYADLYETRQQDSRDLNEPLTNIQNGLGIFSAFNSDSVFFNVVPE